jgi:hypothetical protein
MYGWLKKTSRRVPEPSSRIASKMVKPRRRVRIRREERTVPLTVVAGPSGTSCEMRPMRVRSSYRNGR